MDAGRGNEHLLIANHLRKPTMTAHLSPSSRPMRVHGPRVEPSRVMTPLRELALLPLIEDAPPETEAPFSRCGWFDSSLELAAGLEVTEFVDVLPPDLPLQLA